MNKKSNLLLKIIILIVFIFSIIAGAILLPSAVNGLKGNIDLLNRFTQQELETAHIDIKEYIKINIFQILLSIVSVLFSGIVCFIVWFKDAKILTENAIDRIHATKETLEEEKRAKLKREIAQKQAELEKMNNEPTDTE